jgi:hypothetical protein
MCNLKEDPGDRGKFYCVNCLWKKQTKKTDSIQTTPTPRRQTKKEQRDRQSRSKEQRGRRDGKRSSKSGKNINYQLDTTPHALDKADPNYCSDDAAEYDDMDDSYTRYEEEDEKEGGYPGINQESDWPTIKRRVSFNDDIGKALETFIPREEVTGDEEEGSQGGYSSCISRTATGGSTPTEKQGESPEAMECE